MSRARVVDTIPVERGAFAHHPPVLLLTREYIYNLRFDPSKTGSIICASLKNVSESMERGWREIFYSQCRANF